MRAERRQLSGPRGRLAWTLPVASVLTTLGLAGFLEILVREEPPPPRPNAVALQIVELPPEPSQAATPPTHTTAPPTPVQPPPPPPKPTPVIKTPPSTPVQPPPPPKPTPPIEQPSPPPPPPARALPPPPPPPPASPPKNEPARVQPHRERVRAAPQHPAAASTEAAPAAPATRNFTGGITMGARALYRPMPDIPEELRHREMSVVAMARFHVAADGSATVDLLQATADPNLNAALISALQKWRFFPAMDNGRPIASTIDIRIPIQIR